MNRFASVRGETRIGSILTLAVIAFAVYVGVQFAPVLTGDDLHVPFSDAEGTGEELDELLIGLSP